ncbi:MULTISPECIES: hypothetical protein [unclassified Microbacterium]|uniref:hypothetical protein n=1 Tax=unclassified Microbacterium TaxID=2609290 RepID=UPI0030177998
MTGPFLFHAATTLLPGTDALLPASAIAAIDDAAYRRMMAAYDDSPERRRLRDTVVPVIGLRWTEVVFLSPIHPHAFWSAWREITGEELPPRDFWAIPLDAVPRDAVVFDRTTSAVGDPIHDAEVVPLVREAYRASSRTTDANRAWLRRLAASGRRGAWFNLTPHVLTARPVPLDGASTVSWDRPPGI